MIEFCKVPYVVYISTRLCYTINCAALNYMQQDMFFLSQYFQFSMIYFVQNTVQQSAQCFDTCFADGNDIQPVKNLAPAISIGSSQWLK